MRPHVTSSVRPSVDGEGSHDLVGRLLDLSHTLHADDLETVVQAEVTRAGGLGAVLYLQDYDQQVLQPLGEGAGGEALPVEGSPAGEAFSSGTTALEPLGHGVRVWAGMLDGTDRVGVVGLDWPEVGEREEVLTARVASLVAELVVSKGQYSDRFFRVRRRREMTLAAEMQWHLLPPLSTAREEFSIAGALEPAYEVGGDVFDYAVNGDVLHLGIFDAMGHGTEASLMAALAVGAYRHARRQGVVLAEKYAIMDRAVAEQMGPDRFVTVQLGDLDLVRGVLTLVNAGHPLPLLVRDGKVVGEIPVDATLPVGFGGSTPQVRSQQLQAGDRVVFHTDGVTDSRDQDGNELGDEGFRRLVEEASSGEPLVSTLVRELTRKLLARQANLNDDASILVMEWRGRQGAEQQGPLG